jgi:uncharacterized protein (TIGR03067 family)
MKFGIVLVTSIVLFGTAVYSAGENDPLQGTWTVVKMERGGKQPPAELLKSLKVVIKNDTLRLTDGARGEGATFKHSDPKNPQAIDLLFKEGPNEDIERTALGIFEIDGDNLKLAWRKDGGKRPTEFSSIPGERTSELLILKREKN